MAYLYELGKPMKEMPGKTTIGTPTDFIYKDPRHWEQPVKRKPRRMFSKTYKPADSTIPSDTPEDQPQKPAVANQRRRSTKQNDTDSK